MVLFVVVKGSERCAKLTKLFVARCVMSFWYCNFDVCFFDFEKFSMSASSVKADTEVRIWPSPNPIYIYVKVKIPRYRLFVCLLFGPKQTYNYFIYFTILTIFSISRLFCERKTKCGPKYADVSKRKQNTPKTYCLPILRILVTFQL